MANFLSHKIPFVNSSWIVAHNSFSNKEDGWFYAQQSYNLTSLFEKGVRGFMMDIHYNNNEISLCHELSPKRNPSDECFATKAGLGFVSSIVKLESFLISLYSLIVKNPNEIIILFLECYVPVQEVKNLFVKTNLSQFILTINPNNPDLTIGEILRNKTPLIIFTDYAYGKQYLLDGFFHTKYYKESKYNLAEYRGCEDRNEWSRTKYNEKQFQDQEINLFLLNHFYKTSFNFILNANTYHNINSYHAIKERGAQCQKEFSLFPNFIAIDYVEEGNWGGVIAYINEQNYKVLCAITSNDCNLAGESESQCYVRLT